MEEADRAYKQGLAQVKKVSASTQAPARPPTAYNYFVKDWFAEQGKPGETLTDQSTEASQAWNALAEAEKDVYYSKAAPAFRQWKDALDIWRSDNPTAQQLAQDNLRHKKTAARLKSQKKRQAVKDAKEAAATKKAAKKAAAKKAADKKKNTKAKSSKSKQPSKAKKDSSKPVA